MNRRILYIIIGILAICGSTNAQTLSVDPIKANKGEQTTMTVKLSSAASATALQFNLSLPANVTFDESGCTLGNAASNHRLSVNKLKSGDYLFVLYSMDFTALTDGTLLTIPVTIASDASTGNGSLTTVRSAKQDAVSHHHQGASFTVTVADNTAVENIHHLTFVVNNEKVAEQDMEEGTTITLPTSTDSEGNAIAWYTYPETMPAHDLVVYGLVVKQPEPEVFVWLTMKDGQGTTRIKVKQGAEQVLTIMPEEGWKVVSVMMDGTDVTAQMGLDGSFTTPALTQDATIDVVYEQEVPSGAASARCSQTNVKVVDDGVVISNAEPDTRCTVYAANGQQVVSTVIDGGSRKITLQKGQVYVLTLGSRTLKFAL